MNTDYDVIISGCGPTGAALANLLGEEGVRVAIADASAMEGVAVLRPTDDCFRSWIAETGAPAALIRPDRYVYATIRDRNDLVQKLSSLASSL